MTPATFTLQRFADVADTIGATASKLEKTRLLSDYLTTLDRGRLPVATRFFAGRVFPSWDPRVLAVGGAALSGVLREVSGVDEAALTASYHRHADAGDTAFEVLASGGHQGLGGIDILEVADALDGIAAGGVSRQRALLLRDLLLRCTPAEARMVIKLITGDMRIGLREGLVEDAIGHAFARDAAAVSRADMLIGDLGEVALMARDDRLAEAAPRTLAPLRFMLASAAADADEVVRRLGEEVWVEDKYDGIRCQLHRGEGEVRLFSRDLKTISHQFPEVVEAAAALGPGLILDGEVLAMREGRVLPFSALQTRLGRLNPSAALREQVPVVYVAWDVLHLDDTTLLDVPLRERRTALESLRLGQGFALAHQEQAIGAARLDALFDEARSRLNEGLMCKDPDSPYLPGRRGLYWLKLKRPLDTLDCVVIGAERGNGRRRDVLSDVTFGVRVDDSDELVPIGKAYTGLTDAEILEMTGLLEASTLWRFGRYRTVRPEIVVEIAFDTVQASKRHRSGYALRFPRIARWRRDKGVGDIDVLSRVAALAAVRETAEEQRVDPASARKSASEP